jgi:hypothetical protein
MHHNDGILLKGRIPQKIEKWVFGIKIFRKNRRIICNIEAVKNIKNYSLYSGYKLSKRPKEYIYIFFNGEF